MEFNLADIFNDMSNWLEAFSEMMTLSPITQEDIDAVAAVQSGDPTPEQLAHCTKEVHRKFDENDGCMVDTVREGTENGYPHYAMNHAIRTYVRATDLREAQAQAYKISGDASVPGWDPFAGGKRA